MKGSEKIPVLVNFGQYRSHFTPRVWPRDRKNFKCSFDSPTVSGCMRVKKFSAVLLHAPAMLKLAI